jgi:protein-S-isoprenylcysteine O-methyltransferase Ste14
MGTLGFVIFMIILVFTFQKSYFNIAINKSDLQYIRWLLIILFVLQWIITIWIFKRG